VINHTNINIYIIIIAIAFLCACSNENDKSALKQVSMNPQDIVLFYLDSLKNCDLEKIVTVNNNSDTFKITHADWIKEMDFLEAINTNKPAYKGTLELDSVYLKDTLIYHLVCNDQKLNLKEASIYYYKHQLLHMSMKSFGSNFLFNNAKEIYFNPLKGYSIKGFQKLDLLSKQEIAYRIQVNKI
jgi:hypothetical protein